jgi:nucleotide-binding universal stress UspA family protein
MFPFRRILHPTDFSEQANNAFQVACALAQTYAAKVTVMHVLDMSAAPMVNGVMPEVIAPARDEVRDKLVRIPAPDAAVEVDHVLAEGLPAREIVKVAQDTGCDLIVMGAHGRGFLGRLILGNVAEGVVRKATCPVLTVREPVDFQLEPFEALEEAALVG